MRFLAQLAMSVVPKVAKAISNYRQSERPAQDWKNLKEKVSRTVDHTISSTSEIAHNISTNIADANWFRHINTYTSELSKAMDAKFLHDGISKAMVPSNHRIFDGGHDILSTIERAKHLATEHHWSELHTFQEWAKSYFTDLSSPAGMPALGKMTEPIYTFLRSHGVKEATARHLVTVNGQETVDACSVRPNFGRRMKSTLENSKILLQNNGKRVLVNSPHF